MNMFDGNFNGVQILEPETINLMAHHEFRLMINTRIGFGIVMKMAALGGDIVAVIQEFQPICILMMIHKPVLLFWQTATTFIFKYGMS
ncbi:MAG: hypothetical protein IPO47_19755 [Bacteroidetes bacterium]|nr:hypothetical protein [Bacteroidota bacterium]